MSPNAQRIAIAEVCGWTCLEIDDHYKTPFGKSPSNYKGPPGMAILATETHNYLTDLNAMHEAEKVKFDPSKSTDFKNRAHGQVLCMDYDRALAALTGSFMANYHATAAQRAEAFLRVLDLWDDTK